MNNKNKDVGALSNLDFSHVVNAAKLVKSGKQWRCPKCNATYWLTTHQKEFLQV